MKSLTLLTNGGDCDCLRIVRAMTNCNSPVWFEEENNTKRREVMNVYLNKFFIDLGYNFKVELIPPPENETIPFWFVGMTIHGEASQLTHFKLRYL